MIPELGQFALILALMVSALLATVPLIGSYKGNVQWMSMARPAVYLEALLVAIAFGCLGWAFLHNDFSVRFVAENSNSELPWFYRLTAIWGGHEGSLLLWMMLLGVWSAAVATFSKRLPLEFISRALSVLGMVAFGFLLFTLLTSNPFARVFPPLPQGRDLNPLLQDPGMIMHPPMLYTGYVGFSVAFSFAIAALLGGKLDPQWARWSRPWTTVAWAFLTLGITLGSWWAYYELGWGGWWFWDPVENASFMPWLVGTALIHSQAVTEQRGAFRGWTVLLAIFAFSLSLLGTFLVRSGVLTSVHAFASDPARGLFILTFLAAVSGGALTLYALRAPRVASGGSVHPISRESLLLTNNLLFTVAAGTVLLGTIYPLAIDALDLGKISVGPPYFGFMFTLLMIPAIALMPAGPFARWKQDDPMRLLRCLWAAGAVGALALLVAAFTLREPSARALLGLAGAGWIFGGTIDQYVQRVRGRLGTGMPLATRALTGMTLAHLGVGVFLLGSTLTLTQSLQRDTAMAPGQAETLGPYTFTFDGAAQGRGPNYTSQEGRITVTKGDRTVVTLFPEKRQYDAGGQVMTESAIDPAITRDLYVAMGNPTDSGGWTVRLYYKPFVRCIWLGSLMMMLGGMLAASDPRYRRKRAREESASTEALAAGSQA